MLQVGAAAIVRHDAEAGWQLLSARRTEPPVAAGLWEFPGGKVERGETPEQCILREIKEELGVDVELRQLVAGPDAGQWHLLEHIAFTFWLCTIAEGQVPQMLEDHDAIAWLAVDELESVPWIPADLPVVRTLAEIMATANERGEFPTHSA